MKTSLVRVEVRKGDIQKSLKLFKRKVEASGHLMELRERKTYTKPTTKRRLLKQKAVRKNQILVGIQKEQSKY
jgi:small subunit ribosomal protein S21